jgi:hypothetical protein
MPRRIPACSRGPETDDAAPRDGREAVIKANENPRRVESSAVFIKPGLCCTTGPMVEDSVNTMKKENRKQASGKRCHGRSTGWVSQVRSPNSEGRKKSEIRTPKTITLKPAPRAPAVRPSHPLPEAYGAIMLLCVHCTDLRISSFGLRSSFGHRISDLCVR